MSKPRRNASLNKEKRASAAPPIYVYRGIHAHHPVLEAAKQGIVIPGDINGSVTPEEHNAGGRSAESPYTSWTYRKSIAETYALERGKGYVILRLNKRDIDPATD